MSKPGGGNSETSERILSIEVLISSKESSDSSVLILFSINSGGGAVSYTHLTLPTKA